MSVLRDGKEAISLLITTSWTPHSITSPMFHHLHQVSRDSTWSLYGRLETSYHSGMCICINSRNVSCAYYGASGLFTIWSLLMESLRVWSVIATHGLLNYSWSFSVSLRNSPHPTPGTFIGLLLNLFKTLIFYL